MLNNLKNKLCLIMINYGYIISVFLFYGMVTILAILN